MFILTRPLSILHAGQDGRVKCVQCFQAASEQQIARRQRLYKLPPLV